MTDMHRMSGTWESQFPASFRSAGTHCTETSIATHEDTHTGTCTHNNEYAFHSAGVHEFGIEYSAWLIMLIISHLALIYGS